MEIWTLSVVRAALADEHGDGVPAEFSAALDQWEAIALRGSDEERERLRSRLETTFIDLLSGRGPIAIDVGGSKWTPVAREECREFEWSPEQRFSLNRQPGLCSYVRGPLVLTYVEQHSAFRVLSGPPWSADARVMERLDGDAHVTPLHISGDRYLVADSSPCIIEAEHAEVRN